MRNSEIVATLETAAKEISIRGWWNPEIYQPDNKPNATCAALAINEVCNSFGETPAITALSNFIGDRDEEDSHYHHITDWNDAQTDGDVVIQTIRDCALNLRFNHQEVDNV